MMEGEQANTHGSELSEGTVEFLWGGLKGGIAFAILGTLGSIRRGKVPLPIIAHTVFNINSTATILSLCVPNWILRSGVFTDSSVCFG